MLTCSMMLTVERITRLVEYGFQDGQPRTKLILQILVVL